MAYESAFSALGDGTRRKIFEAVVAQPTSVTALASNLPVSRPAVSQHLKILSDAGLVSAKPEGTRRIYSANPEGVEALRKYFEGLWGDVLTAFAEQAATSNFTESDSEFVEIARPDN